MQQLAAARAAYAAGDYSVAISLAEKVPSNIQAHTIIAKSALELSDFDRSIRAYEAATALDPLIPLLWKVINAK